MRPNMNPLFESLSGLAVQDVSADDPGAVCKWMIGLDFATVDSQTERARADIEVDGGISQVDPALRGIGFITGDAMMTAEGGDSLACPSIAASCEVAVAVQNASYDVVGCNARKDSNGFDQFTGSLSAALTTATARKAQFGMNAAFPMNREEEFSLRAIYVDQNLLDKRSHNTLF